MAKSPSDFAVDFIVEFQKKHHKHGLHILVVKGGDTFAEVKVYDSWREDKMLLARMEMDVIGYGRASVRPGDYRRGSLKQAKLVGKAFIFLSNLGHAWGTRHESE